MVDVEFVDPETGHQPPDRPSADAPSGRSAGPALLARAAGLLWLIAALGSLVAPFALVYRLSYHTFSFRERIQADGWGRLEESQLPFHQHEVRYGLATCVAAALFAVAAGLTLGTEFGWIRPRRRVRAMRLAIGGVGLGALGLLCGIGAAALLFVQTIRDNIEAQLSSPINDQVIDVQSSDSWIHVQIGWMIWLLAIAAGSGVLALVLGAVAPPTAPVTETAAGSESIDAGDEALAG